jgi:TPR repeat protein
MRAKPEESKRGKRARHTDEGAYSKAMRCMQTDPPDKGRALAFLKEAAASADPDAQYALATWYLFGEGGLRRSRSIARKYMRAAAAKGVVLALFDLGAMLEKGDGGPVDLRAAFRCYVDAALRGDARAVFEVARCLHYGIGCDADVELAAIWSRRAKELRVYEADTADP